jgi:hypothetical protein
MRNTSLHSNGSRWKTGGDHSDGLSGVVRELDLDAFGLWEPLAAASLARLWREQGKREEARDLLVPVPS